ncbi:hypothetical protein Csa_008567, partial [Cucumis sativus]
ILRRRVSKYETTNILASVVKHPIEDTLVDKGWLQKSCRGYFWPTLFQDARNFVVNCDQCQRTGNMARCDEMPQQPILEIRSFDV